MAEAWKYYGKLKKSVTKCMAPFILTAQSWQILYRKSKSMAICDCDGSGENGKGRNGKCLLMDESVLFYDKNRS